jgi:hypothetical protein
MFLFEFSSHSNDIILVFLLKKIILTQVDSLGPWFELYLDLTPESGFITIMVVMIEMQKGMKVMDFFLI